MASISKTGSGKTPGRMIQFVGRDGKRRSIRLGKIGLPAARLFKDKVESLVSCKITGQLPDAVVSTWLAGLSDKLHGRLSSVELVEPRVPPPTSPALGFWLDRYLGQRKGDLKPATIDDYRNTGNLLVNHFGNDTPIDKITPDDAADWRAELFPRLSDATIRKHTRNAKLLFGAALDRETISRNPFKKLVSASVGRARQSHCGFARVPPAGPHCTRSARCHRRTGAARRQT